MGFWARMEPEGIESEFELDRLKRIQRNQEVLDTIGVSNSIECLINKRPCPSKKRVKPPPDVGNKTLRRSSRPGARKTQSKISALNKELHSSSEAEESESVGEWEEDSGLTEAESLDEEEILENTQKALNGSDGGLKEGGSSSSLGANRSLSKKPKKMPDSSSSWPDSDAEEVKRAYLLFAKEGGGLMTMESVVKVASKLSMHLSEDQVKAMEEYAISKTSCHPRCLTLSELRLLIKALTQSSISHD